MDKFYRLIQLQAIGYFLIFSAFNAIQNLAGSIPSPTGLPNATFFVLYAMFCIGCVPAPQIVAYLGPKRSMVVGGLMYLGVCISHLFPSLCTSRSTSPCLTATALWIIHLTFGAFCGIGAALIWTGQGVYLSRVALHAAAAAGDDVTATFRALSSSSNESTRNTTGRSRSRSKTNEMIGTLNKRYNGVFFSFLQFSGVTGNLAAFLLTTFVPGINNALHWLFIGLSLMCSAGILVLALCLPPLKTRNATNIDSSNDSAFETSTAESGTTAAATAPTAATTTATTTTTTPTTTSNSDFLSTLRLCAFDIRMRCLVPIIFYNGASLGFLWSVFNSLGWNTSAGLSFVALGSAYWFAVNTIFSPLLSKLSEKKSYIASMLVATLVQSIMYVCLIVFTIKPLQCNTSGCMTNTSGPCWSPGVQNELLFPFNCSRGSRGSINSQESKCVQCSAYNIAQKCDSGLNQCAWLGYPRGDAFTPDTNTMILLFTCSTLFAIGDAVWETQLPSILQTIFKDDSDKVSQSISNLKMFQSIGVTLMFACASMNDIQLMSMLLLLALGWGTLCMYYVHVRVVNLDTGISKAIGGGTAMAEERDSLLVSEVVPTVNH